MNAPASIPAADYIIIGAGSAGCAIAARLGAHGKHSILVLEYGGADTSPFIQMPAALSMPMRNAPLRLGLSKRARTRAQQPHPRHPPRQSHRRFVLHQRHDLRARTRRRFQPLASPRRKRLGLCRCPPLFQTHGKLAREGDRRFRISW